MADDEATRLRAVSQEQEPVFIFRVIRVIDQAGALVQKNGLCLLECNAMFCMVGLGFMMIPGKCDIAQSIIVAIRRSLPENTQVS
jgi:hypothetical protein